MENDSEYENLYESEEESYSYENENDSENEFNGSEMEMADELLAVQGEDEMDRYLKRLFRRAAGRKRSMDSRMVDALAILLKGLSKKLFRQGRRNRHALGSMMLEQENAFRSEFLGQEYEGLNQEEQEFEARRSFVRLAGSAARHAARMHHRYSPRWRARRALALAARKHAPGIYNPSIITNLTSPAAASGPSPALSQRLNSLENAIGSLTEKINNMKPAPDNNPPAATPPAKDDTVGADTEYEWMQEEEWEGGDYEHEDYEGEEYEGEDHEWEDHEDEYEEQESMSNEYEEYEEGESEDREWEENESEGRKIRRRRKGKCNCGCAGKTNEYEEQEFEENEFEENEYEDNEFEENEYEENEHEEQEYEDNEFEENEYEEQEYAYEFENDGEAADRESTFSEAMQMELASELLNVQTEEELDLFLGKLLKKAGRLVKKVSKVALPGPLGKVLKGIAKKVLPMAGGVVGGMFVPGLGNVVGKAVGDAASKAFEMEFEGMSREDQEFEKAKAFVRFAGNAGVRSALLRRRLPARAKTKVALRHAARKYAPGLLRRSPVRRNFRHNGVNRRPPVRHSAAYWRNKRNQQRRRQQQYRKLHPNRFSAYQRNLWRQRYPGRPFPVNGYSGRAQAQPMPYQGNASQPYYGGNYPAQPNDLPPQYSTQPQQADSGQDSPFNQKLNSLENALAQLTQKISSMNAPAGSNSHDLSTGNDDGGNDSGNEGAENKYWN